MNQDSGKLTFLETRNRIAEQLWFEKRFCQMMYSIGQKFLIQSRLCEYQY